MIVDVGAKFGSNLQILKSATRLIGQNLKSKIDDHKYRMDYIRLNVESIFKGDQYVDFYQQLFSDLIVAKATDETKVSDFKDMPLLFR